MSTLSTTGVKPKASHLELRSGIYLDYLDPKAEDIRLDDLSLSLSNTCRWGGHCDPFYSVAEHACLVHDIVASWAKAWGYGPKTTWQLRMGALHHDDHEAYVGDIPTPLKGIWADSYYEVTDQLDIAIGDALDLNPCVFKANDVKRADTLALFIEAEKFKPSKGLHWNGRPSVVALPPDVIWSCGNSPSVARERWLDRHYELEARRP